MKIYLIGATGKTGLQLVQQALKKGYQLTALVRNPGKLNVQDPNLSIIKGDVLHLSSFEDSLQNHDVVISALGHKKFIIKTTILSKGTENLIKALNKHQIKRFICITSLGINDSRFKLGLYYTFFTIPFILYFYFKDKAKQENLITNSDLDWTIVRPGQLTNGKLTKHYNTGTQVGNYFLTKMISRANVAHFMLDIFKNKKYIYQKPGIVN